MNLKTMLAALQGITAYKDLLTSRRARSITGWVRRSL